MQGRNLLTAQLGGSAASTPCCVTTRGSACCSPTVGTGAVGNSFPPTGSRATRVRPDQAHLLPGIAHPFAGYGYQVWIHPGKRRFALSGLLGGCSWIPRADSSWFTPRCASGRTRLAKGDERPLARRSRHAGLTLEVRREFGGVAARSILSRGKTEAAPRHFPHHTEHPRETQEPTTLTSPARVETRIISLGLLCSNYLPRLTCQGRSASL